MSHRVLVGQFMFEANSFSAGRTSAGDFGDFVLDPATRAEELARCPGEFGAACRELVKGGYELVPSVAAACGAGPVLDDAFVAELVDRAAAAVTDDLDGCYFALHGASVAESDDDPEGTLVGALRDRLGGRILVISLDLHAQLTEKTVAAVNAIATYRTSPHIDIAETGTRAARLLIDALEGKTRPVVAMAARPMITPADTHNSECGPYRRLMQLCHQAERRGALAASLCTTQPWLDIAELGWRAVVTTDGDMTLAARLAEEIAAAAWDDRQALGGTDRPTIAEALAEALAGPGPCVVSEASDSTNAGALGDSTEMLRAALPYADRAIYLSTRDPGAAAAAFSAGQGAGATFRVGRGRTGPTTAQSRSRRRSRSCSTANTCTRARSAVASPSGRGRRRCSGSARSGLSFTPVGRCSPIRCCSRHSASIRARRTSFRPSRP